MPEPDVPLDAYPEPHHDTAAVELIRRRSRPTVPGDTP